MPQKYFHQPPQPQILGLFANQQKIFLYSSQNKNNHLKISVSEDIFSFFESKPDVELKSKIGKTINTKNITNLYISKNEDEYLMVFKTVDSVIKTTAIASSKDLLKWQIISNIPSIKESGLIIKTPDNPQKYLLFYGESSIRYASSNDLLKWKLEKKSLVLPEEDFFGTSPLKIGAAFITEKGIELLYYVYQGKDNGNKYYLRSLLLDLKNPSIILEKGKEPLWETPEDWFSKDIKPVGIIKYKKTLISFWNTRDGLFSVIHPYLVTEKSEEKNINIILKKSEENPIIKPIVNHYWESKATFNPGAVYDQGKVHLLYRAIGDNDVSVIGYAQTSDGTHIDYRSLEPVYTPREPFESSNPYKPAGFISSFTSGGGCFGGCEDPRITKIDDKLYMTYVAFDGYNGPKVALTSITADDFHKERWNKWKKPVIISRPNVIDKNACILPEKINGKYVIFHRIFPDILVDYVDNLDFDGKRFLKGEYKIKPRKYYWDSRKIGAGAPPLKTRDGWLMIYQAVGEEDSSRYKMGAMLLDLNDPTKVLYRSSKPILEPDQYYENEGWKAGVAYPCGAVNLNNDLYIYYGGADMVTCVAKAPLDEFVGKIKTNQGAEVIPISSKISFN